MARRFTVGGLITKMAKTAKIETFRDISRNVEIRVIWFSELRTMVMVASFC